MRIDDRLSSSKVSSSDVDGRLSSSSSDETAPFLAAFPPNLSLRRRDGSLSRRRLGEAGRRAA